MQSQQLSQKTPSPAEEYFAGYFDPKQDKMVYSVSDKKSFYQICMDVKEAFRQRRVYERTKVVAVIHKVFKASCDEITFAAGVNSNGTIFFTEPKYYDLFKKDDPKGHTQIIRGKQPGTNKVQVRSIPNNNKAVPPK